MPCYEIKWREVYEMKAVVSAANFEEAMYKALGLEAATPSLDFFEEWKGDEAVTYADVDGVKVEAELLDRQDPVCLPLGLPGMGKTTEDVRSCEKTEEKKST